MLVNTGKPNAFGFKELYQASAITCRDCYGFGHSIKKCPTGAKLDKLRLTGDIAKKTISRYRSFVSGGFSQNIRANPVFPLVEFFNHYISEPAVKSLSGNQVACV